MTPRRMVAVHFQRTFIERLILLLHGQIPGSRSIRSDRAPRQPLDHQPPHALAHIFFLDRDPCFRDTGQHAAIRIDARGVDQKAQKKRNNVSARDDEDVGQVMILVTLVDGVSRAEEDEAGDDEEEEGKDGAVKDAK